MPPRLQLLGRRLLAKTLGGGLACCSYLEIGSIPSMLFTVICSKEYQKIGCSTLNIMHDVTTHKSPAPLQRPGAFNDVFGFVNGEYVCEVCFSFLPSSNRKLRIERETRSHYGRRLSINKVWIVQYDGYVVVVDWPRKMTRWKSPWPKSLELPDFVVCVDVWLVCKR